MNVLTFFLDALFPVRESDRIARATTLASLAPALAPVTIRIGESDIVALMPYRNPNVRALIREAKYHAHQAATATLASVLSDYLFEHLVDETALERRSAVIVPMPLSERRRRERGYNQVENVCAHLAIPMDTTVLARTRDTKPQTGLGRSARQENVRGAFAARPCDSTLLYILVDDVFTTGATMTEGVRALTDAGAGRVMAVALAH